MKINLIPGNIIDPKEYDIENSRGIDFVIDSFSFSRLKNSLEEGVLLIVGKSGDTTNEMIPKNIINNNSGVITTLIDYIIEKIWDSYPIAEMPILKSIDLDLDTDCIVI